MTLSLPPPSGHRLDAWHVVITCDRHRAIEVSEVCLEFGCNWRTQLRVMNSLKYSGRYDCLLAPFIDIPLLEHMLSLYDAKIEYDRYHPIGIKQTRRSLSRNRSNLAIEHRRFG